MIASTADDNSTDWQYRLMWTATGAAPVIIAKLGGWYAHSKSPVSETTVVMFFSCSKTESAMLLD